MRFELFFCKFSNLSLMILTWPSSIYEYFRCLKGYLWIIMANFVYPKFGDF